MVMFLKRKRSFEKLREYLKGEGVITASSILSNIILMEAKQDSKKVQLT